MKNILQISDSLRTTPQILAELISEIPAEVRKRKRIKNAWSIHEHICHVCVGEKFAFHPRFKAFLHDSKPVFEPVSGDDFSDSYYYNLDLYESLKEFKKLRTKTVSMVQTAPHEIWEKRAVLPEYEEYTPYIMLRHLLMHDYWHLYRVEELWLTVDEYLV